MSHQKQNTFEDQLLQLISHKIALPSGRVCIKAQRCLGSPNSQIGQPSIIAPIHISDLIIPSNNHMESMDGRSSQLYRSSLRMLKRVHNSHLTVKMVMLGQHNSWLMGSNSHAWPA